MYKQGLLRSNPCAEALVAKPYTNDEIAVIKRIANDDSDLLTSYMALILLLAICTGLRPSELVALTLNDLRKGDTLDTFELVINKALAITTASSTKNRSSNRVILLNTSSVEAIKKISNRNNIGFEQAVSSSLSELPLVRDPMTNQAFVNPKSLYNRSKAALKNRVCYRGVQPCRHSFATVCADGNISFENIASMLGHSSTTMVKTRYALYRKTAEGAQVLTQMNNLF
ncbi:tyrosine-type recombinase/integrase [Vibrio splendidus]|uniref:tyrosine-type recombinase/integrase n=1 Tax=Vibrio splendidus TaxID=29497 RepID=UPI0034E45E45